MNGKTKFPAPPVILSYTVTREKGFYNFTPNRDDIKAFTATSRFQAVSECLNRAESQDYRYVSMSGAGIKLFAIDVGGHQLVNWSIALVIYAEGDGEAFTLNDLERLL